MVKKQINFRASDLTREQLDKLQEWWGATQSEAITVAVDRAYREELRIRNRGEWEEREAAEAIVQWHEKLKARSEDAGEGNQGEN